MPNSQPVHPVPASLEAIKLFKTIQGKLILNGVSFSVKQGSIVGLLGPNGAGKTTAFYSVAGLVRPDRGQIRFLGQDIGNLAPHRRARLGMGFLAQEPSIFRDLTVEENLTAALELQTSHYERIASRVDAALAQLRLSHLRKRRSALLSGGERRRLEIARTLIHEPKFILLDEPFANVDPRTIQNVQTMARELRAQGIGILLTDHNVREIFEIADYCFLMNAGELLAEGTPHELMHSDVVRERYLGSSFRM